MPASSLQPASPDTARQVRLVESDGVAPAAVRGAGGIAVGDFNAEGPREILPDDLDRLPEDRAKVGRDPGKLPDRLRVLAEDHREGTGGAGGLPKPEGRLDHQTVDFVEDVRGALGAPGQDLERDPDRPEGRGRLDAFGDESEETERGEGCGERGERRYRYPDHLPETTEPRRDDSRATGRGLFEAT